MRRPLTAVAGFLLLTAAAVAQEAKPVGRFQITPSEEGFTRLDTETGSVAHCGRREGVWYCEPLAGADTGREQKLDRLAGEVARLSEDLAALAARIDALAGRLEALAVERLSAGAPAEEETRRTDEAFGFAERVMRRFFDMVREMKRAEADPI